MPAISREHMGVAFDMEGCPNRCRHCYLGSGNEGTLSEEDVRWGVAQFRDYLARGSKPIRKLSVSTWFREPDFRDDYRHLYDLEAELSDGAPSRYELLSVWRLARDDAYAKWARSVGPDTCQISFFGMRETSDWFYRRTGAFDDALAATERLLTVGMKPRWQILLTTKLLTDLRQLLALVDELNLRERVAALGAEFEIFMHPPGPDHEARRIEHLRPTADQLAELPSAILEPTRRHFGTDVLWETEQVLYERILGGDETVASEDSLPEVLWFLVCHNWEVFANVGTLEPWWRLGNLKVDPVASIIRTFEDARALGLHVQFHEPRAELAARYGDPQGQRVYSTIGDLLLLYRARRCEAEWVW
jgi:hypothetical protein